MGKLANKRVLILHGWGGSDYPHWQAWLASELVKEYADVKFPLLSNPHFPSKNRWIKELHMLMSEFKPDMLICHSLASTLWFHYINLDYSIGVESLLLVAPPKRECAIETIGSFFPYVVQKELKASQSLLVTSTTDPYLEPSEANTLANELNISHKVVENAGHINGDSGYGQWPWVLEWVKDNI